MARFVARARALDMLGRQQIAGIPTAISELFKNAQDAYADNVRADLFRNERLLIIRDDGIGMTPEEFEARWLTLGTESKVKGGPLALPPKPQGKPDRPIMGEKGIGRLAIGVIGPQVLVLTRAVRETQKSDLVAAYVNWRVFSSPGINLSDIEIPIRRYSGVKFPTQRDIDEMVAEFLESTKTWRNEIGSSELKTIQSEAERFSFDPRFYNDELDGPKLTNKESGTQFFVMPVDELLIKDAENSGQEVETASPLTKALIGFSNTMLPRHQQPVINTKFVYFSTPETRQDLISDLEFWTPEEFEMADHKIAGKFDEYGQWRGTVNIYGQEPIKHKVNWLESGGGPTDCGPFSIRFAYVQGRSAETRIPYDKHATIIQKLNRIGGLYLYRDGIRILPYGDTDFDFLDIEKNRTKSASYYYFSYRRMFGAIEISQASNAALSEKSGREGFRDNKAYRQFKEILKNFFLQLATDFFREGGAYSDLFSKQKEEFDRQQRARKEREKQTTARRALFSAQLETAFKKFDSGQIEREISEIVDTAKEKLHAVSTESDPEIAVQQLLKTEIQAGERFRGVVQALRVSKPRGIGLNKQLSRDWEAYQVEAERLQDQILAKAEAEVHQLVTSVATEAKIALNNRRRVDELLKTRTTESRQRVNQANREVSSTVNDFREQALSRIKQSQQNFESELKNILERAATSNYSEISDKDLATLIDGLEKDLTLLTEDTVNVITSLQQQFELLQLGDDGEKFDSLDVAESMESELLELREQSEQELQLVQIGMAIEIINHEFNQSVRSIRNNLKRLSAWASANPKIADMYRELRASFDHLDGYLALFTPLHKRLYGSPIEIQGSEIQRFVKDVFAEQLKNHKITLETSDAFDNHKMTLFPASIYPIFLNLIDNSIFWIKDKSGKRCISLDADDQGLIVKDNGPGVSKRDWERIFEMGFTRKPGGRGMGLYISREVLERAGYRLTIERNLAGGTQFRITKIQDE